AQLQPAAPAEAGLIEKLIEHLDSGEFKARQQAHSQLLQIGDRAMPYIEKALSGQLPLETKQRLEILHGKLLPGELTGDRLRQVRAVEVLELIGNAVARQLLQALADGAPGALTTTHARAALARLKKR